MNIWKQYKKKNLVTRKRSIKAWGGKVIYMFLKEDSFAHQGLFDLKTVILWNKYCVQFKITVLICNIFLNVIHFCDGKAEFSAASLQCHTILLKLC